MNKGALGFTERRLKVVRFEYTGATQSLIVPDNVYELYAELAGAGGGPGSWQGTFYRGGAGLIIGGPLYVEPGDLLYVYPGGPGIGTNASCVGGYNGGGNGSSDGANHWGGGGGGRTDIRHNKDVLGCAVAIAPGGGGGGIGPFGGDGCIGVGGDGQGGWFGEGGRINRGGRVSVAGLAGPGKLGVGGDSVGNFGNQRCGGGGGGLFGGAGGGNSAGEDSGGGGGCALLPDDWKALGYNNPAAPGYAVIKIPEAA